MLMQPSPIVKKAYSLLYEEENQRGLIDFKVIQEVHALNLEKSSPTP